MHKQILNIERRLKTNINIPLSIRIWVNYHYVEISAPLRGENIEHEYPYEAFIDLCNGFFDELALNRRMWLNGEEVHYVDITFADGGKQQVVRTRLVGDYLSEVTNQLHKAKVKVVELMYKRDYERR